jgi:hypothetical protein
VKLAGYIDLFNMFNNQQPTARYARQCKDFDPEAGICKRGQADPRFKRPTAWQAPRRFQIGFKIEY